MPRNHSNFKVNQEKLIDSTLAIRMKAKTKPNKTNKPTKNWHKPIGESEKENTIETTKTKKNSLDDSVSEVPTRNSVVILYNTFMLF